MQNTQTNKDDSSESKNKSPKMAKPVTGTFKQRRKELRGVVKRALKTQQKPKAKGEN